MENLEMKGGVPSSEKVETFEGDDEVEGDQHVQDMDLGDDDFIRKQYVSQQSELVATVTIADKVNGVDPGLHKDNVCAGISNNGSSDNLSVNERPLSGVKRARMTHEDKQPSVCVIYHSLTRESKKKLMELIQQWSEWQAQVQSFSNVSSEEALENGEETYFPALHVGSEKSATVSFWLDNQARNEDVKESDTVPLYDREYMLGSTSLDGSTNAERIETREASRCFNCGSYSHALKECPKPRDHVAISNARKQHNSKRNLAAGARGQTRYYQKTPGKFDDLRAGVLGAETRECLGIGEFDPPPWLHRMREMGYPPGYLDVVEDEDHPSGISIYADEETKEECEDGELPDKAEPEPPEKKMTVEFPGINAPIPENADCRLWATLPAGPSGSSSFKNRLHSGSNRSESHSGRYIDHSRSSDQRDYGPPGSEHGLASSYPGYSPRYSPYDPMPRSPSLGRSLSERGRPSPLPYDISPVRSPHSPYPFAWESPQYPSPRLDHWSHNSPYGASPDVSSQQERDRHDHRRHHHSHPDVSSQQERDRHDHRRHHHSHRR